MSIKFLSSCAAGKGTPHVFACRTLLAARRRTQPTHNALLLFAAVGAFHLMVPPARPPARPPAGLATAVVV